MRASKIAHSIAKPHALVVVAVFLHVAQYLSVPLLFPQIIPFLRFWKVDTIIHVGEGFQEIGAVRGADESLFDSIFQLDEGGERGGCEDGSCCGKEKEEDVGTHLNGWVVKLTAGFDSRIGG
jgi:hypothetical protein